MLSASVCRATPLTCCCRWCCGLVAGDNSLGLCTRFIGQRPRSYRAVLCVQLRYM